MLPGFFRRTKEGQGRANGRKGAKSLAVRPKGLTFAVEEQRKQLIFESEIERYERVRLDYEARIVSKKAFLTLNSSFFTAPSDSPKRGGNSR